MEYSKEDLMEAKKQIWGVGENMGTEESKKRPFAVWCGWVCQVVTVLRSSLPQVR